MSVGSDAAKIAKEIAANDAHGYDQKNRWGPDYDCSSLVISIYRLLGVPLTCTYTGNMFSDMTAKGFEEVSGENLLPGDVLLNDNHAAIFVGDGKIVAARINEKGTVTGGKTGDQTGTEICEQKFYSGWKHILRFVGKDDFEVTGFPWVEYGSVGLPTYTVQAALNYLHYLKDSDLDGLCGPRTTAAIKQFQHDNGLEVDGIAGNKTLGALFNK